MIGIQIGEACVLSVGRTLLVIVVVQILVINEVVLSEDDGSSLANLWDLVLVLVDVAH